MTLQNLYIRQAAAYVRGEAGRAAKNGGRIDSLDSELRGKALALPERLMLPPLDALTDAELTEIIRAGQEAGLKLYRFKNTHDQLARVKRVIGYLRGQRFSSLLDVGSGRGVFLWPFLESFPWVDTLSMDLLDCRVEFLQKTAEGGLPNFRAVRGDLCLCPEIPDHSRDIVTLLEVLEHIPDTAKALASAVRVARRGLVISVPNQPDNNPEHIHLFTKASMTAALEAAGCRRISFDAVPGHMIVFARPDDAPED